MYDILRYPNVPRGWDRGDLPDGHGLPLRYQRFRRKVWILCGVVDLGCVGKHKEAATTQRDKREPS